MTFKDSIRTCLNKYVTFSGRASRSEYWWFLLFVGLGTILTLVIGGLVSGLFSARGFEEASNGNFRIIFMAGVLPGLFYLAMFLPMISALVRRFHDRDMSGWWVLGFMVVSQVPYIGVLFSLGQTVITALKGTAGVNRFGADPLQTQHSADVFR